MKKLIITIVLTTITTITAALAQFTGPGENEPPKPTYDKSWVASWFLFQKYDQNPIAADAKYRYETIVIVGVVKDIGRDVMGNPYVVLSGVRRNEYGFGGVQCIFAVENEYEIAEISEGQKVAITGEVKGLILFNVLVSDCQFTDLPVRIEKAVAHVNN